MPSFEQGFSIPQTERPIDEGKLAEQLDQLSRHAAQLLQGADREHHRKARIIVEMVRRVQQEFFEAAHDH